MKLIGTFLIVSFAIVVNAGIDIEKAKEMAAKMLTVCKTKEGGSDADYDLIMNLEFPGTPEGNCMLACIHESMGFHTDGKFNRDIFMIITQQVTENDPIYMKAAEEVSTKCGVIEGSRCDQAVEFDKCLEDEVKARNLMPKFL